MPKILIIGATGTIGNSLALSLLRTSNTVFGLARTAQKALHLASQEIIPVLGTVLDSYGYITAINSNNIDLVIDASFATTDAWHLLEMLKMIGHERLERYESNGIRGSKLGFLYVSGMRVHGNTFGLTSDTDAIAVPYATAQPPKLAAWRPKLEQGILASSDVLDVAVVRPANIYGGLQKMWRPLLLPVRDAAKTEATTVTIQTSEDSAPGLIHIDDAVSGLHLVAEKIQLLNNGSLYPIFVLGTSQEKMRDILEAAAKVWGYRGEIILGGFMGNLVMEGLGLNFRADSSRATQLLNWHPKRLDGFVGRMPTFLAALEAHLKLENTMM
jgi:nucleoside-diphosphate-sugar epimerase